MPPRKKTPQVGSTHAAAGGSGGSDNALLSAPNRTFYALDLLMPQENRAGHSYSQVLKALMSEFEISESQAERDIAKAYDIIRRRVANTDFATMVKVELARLAERAAERGDVGDWSVAKGAWERLGKWAGLEQGDEESLAKKLTDAALDIAIKQAMEERIAGMTDEEFEALAKRRKEKAA